MNMCELPDEDLDRIYQYEMRKIEEMFGGLMTSLSAKYEPSFAMYMMNEACIHSLCATFAQLESMDKVKERSVEVAAKIITVVDHLKNPSKGETLQ